MRPIRVAVTGAAGQVCYSLLTRIVQGDLFGDQPIELRLLDVPKALRAVEGVVMELQDCASTRLVSIETGSDARRIFDGCNVAMLVGASPRRKGMQRRDLIEANAHIFAEQGRALAESAGENVRVVVTGNPSNTNALVAAHHAAGIPAERFTALTRLDHDRARSAIARRTRQRVCDVRRLVVWGNHSATQYPDVSHALVRGRPLSQWIDDAWGEFDFVPMIAHRGSAIIEARGRSSAASAANATIAHIRDWMLGTPVGDWTSMGVPSPGIYGIPEGIVASMPVTCAAGHWQIVPDLELSALTRARIRTTVDELLAERSMLEQLGLLPNQG